MNHRSQRHHLPALALALLTLTLLAGACVFSRHATAWPAPGDYQFELEHEGRVRSYRVHVPPPASAPTLFPVVLSFHGGGGNAWWQQMYTQMDPLADREGFLVVYPNGTGALPDRLLTWNAGRCCGYAMEHAVDDVGFTRAVLDDLAARIPVDPARVYATGLSNGAMMAYRLAAEAPDRVAAIAPVAGVIGTEGFAPARPVPILHIHSVDDPRALYGGGLSPPFPGTNRRVDHLPVEDALAQWRARAGCPDQPIVGATVGPSPAGHTATRYTYGPCAGGGEIVLWKLTGAGHVWPGGQPGYLEAVLGPSTDVINANAEMWAFFSRYVLPIGNAVRKTKR